MQDHRYVETQVSAIPMILFTDVHKEDTFISNKWIWQSINALGSPGQRSGLSLHQCSGP
jgi:hypothetical protein